VLSNVNQTDAWLSYGLAFVGGYGDAASFVLAKTFTGHVTGNLVLAAIAGAVAGCPWASLGHFHFLDRNFRERAYRAPPQGVVIVAVASYRNGDRSDSDSGRFLGVGIRYSPRN
jgi:hypothetical protein